MKVFYFGAFDPYNLESSYLRAGKALGFATEVFDYAQSYRNQLPFGRIGAFVARYIEPHQWLLRMNREVTLKATEFQPDVFLIFCNAKIMAGTLLYLKSVMPKTKFVLIWPDPLNNLQSHLLASAKLLDMLASYSSNAVPVFQQAGFTNVQWIPLAGDTELHPCSQILPEVDFNYDISFVGGWRPEREDTMIALLKKYGSSIKIGIYGPSWAVKTRNQQIRKLVIPHAVLGKDMAKVFQKSRINLNRIDVTNYPAANMRFFEIPASGGLMLSSSCPEMSEVFKEFESVVYFKNNFELINKVEYLLNNDSRRMREVSHQIILNGHTYRHRLEKIISNI